MLITPVSPLLMRMDLFATLGQTEPPRTLVTRPSPTPALFYQAPSHPSTNNGPLANDKSHAARTKYGGRTPQIRSLNPVPAPKGRTGPVRHPALKLEITVTGSTIFSTHAISSTAHNINISKVESPRRRCDTLRIHLTLPNPNPNTRRHTESTSTAFTIININRTAGALTLRSHNNRPRVKGSTKPPEYRNQQS